MIELTKALRTSDPLSRLEAGLGAGAEVIITSQVMTMEERNERCVMR